jgi:sugar phosphate isomerase/epimerase
MRLGHLPGDVHLTYCTNIHAGESWPEVRDSLESHLPRIKAAVSPGAPLGLGLRLSAIAAQALSEPSAFEELRAFLSRHDLYVFTINAFPYGPFHGTRVKEDVYQPDWLTAERLTYTDQSAEILAGLLPEGLPGSVSTVPGTFKAVAAQRPDAPRTMADMMARHAATLVRLQQRTGHEIVLALEPEPCCFLETIDETIAFFRDHVHTDASAAIVAEATGLSREQAREALRRHLGVCYDICHGAVEFEDPADAFARLSAAGIRIAKLQLSSALRVPAVGPDTETSLAAFDDGVYLHQVVERRNGAITRHVDLAPAFAALRSGNGGGEWRVHCHVPVFLEVAGKFHSTQPTLKAALACTKSGFVAPHLEVETYTWDVLPPELRQGSRAEAIAREMNWVLGELAR